jgi:predicted nucleic acid-binding protein
MNTLLDTCVLSEFSRRSPNPKVVEWLEGQEEAGLFISAITIGEIQGGIELLAVGGRRDELAAWLQNGLIVRFGGRVLALDTATLVVWGSLTAGLQKSGQPMGVMDSLIAATALRHDLALATRNSKDFATCGVQLINPWE